MTVAAAPTTAPIAAAPAIFSLVVMWPICSAAAFFIAFIVFFADLAVIMTIPFSLRLVAPDATAANRAPDQRATGSTQDRTERFRAVGRYSPAQQGSTCGT